MPLNSVADSLERENLINFEREVLNHKVYVWWHASQIEFEFEDLTGGTLWQGYLYPKTSHDVKDGYCGFFDSYEPNWWSDRQDDLGRNLVPKLEVMQAVWEMAESLVFYYNLLPTLIQEDFQGQIDDECGTCLFRSST